MVKVAVAGGTGNVATTLLRATIASNLHEVCILTRSTPSAPLPGVTYKQVDYQNRDELAAALQGFDVCLSFIVVHTDTGCTIQHNLLQACLTAGVRRFAPSEWSIASNSGVPPYANKDAMAADLAMLRDAGELGALEYCLFQPSVFMDYFAHPHSRDPHLATWSFFIDLEQRRAIVLDNGEHEIVVTAAADAGEVLRLALGDPRAWPAVGGMRGAKTSMAELVDIGMRIRPGMWDVEYVKGEDILNGVVTASWVPRLEHPIIPVEQREAYSKQFIVMFFQAVLNGSWVVGEQWNERFPDYKFMSAEEYLTEAWRGKA